MVQEAFLWGRAGAKLTPDQIAREREAAEALAKGAMDYSPVGHWSQGLNRVAQGLLAGLDYRMLGQAEKENATYNTDIINSLLGGTSAAPAASTMPATTGAGAELAATSPASGMDAYRNAIASIESAGSGDYSAVGPTNPNLGRALGRYQIMEANIGPWSQEALGRAVTPDEFLANPQLQDAIFDKKFGSYLEQFGPEGAAQAWFAGPGGVGKLDRKDVLGTSVAAYSQKFNNAIGGAPAAIEAAAPSSGYVDPMVSAPNAAPQTAEAPPLPAPVEVAPAPAVAAVPQQVAQAITPQTPAINPAILRALTDPRATPQTRAVAQALMQQEARKQEALQEQQTWMARQQYEQQQQASDPLRRLQIQKAERDLSAPNIPESVQALNIRAQQAGLQPGTPEYQKFMLSGGDKGITINNEGTIPAGYQAVRDDQGRVTSIAPIPGSPAALEMEQALKAKETQGGRKETATDVITNAASEARNLLKNGWMTTGTVGRVAANLTESDAAELRRQVGVLTSNATIENLTAMRQASPTGGALGSVTEKEGAMLAAAAGAIDPNAGKAQVEKALDNYEKTLLRVIHGPKVGDAIYEQTRQPKGAVINGYQIEEVTE